MIERPGDRYGRRRRLRLSRRWLVLAAVAFVVVAGLMTALVAYHRLSRAAVRGELGAYRLVDDETVSVTISVTRDDPSRPAVCIVRARSVDGSETGRREVLVPPSSQATVQVTTIVKASRRPVVGDVYGCGTEVPSYLLAP